MSNQDLVFRVAALALFVGIRFVRWRARRLVGWQSSWPAMKKNPVDTAALLTLGLSWLTAVVVFVACPALVQRCAAPLADWVRWCGVAGAVAGLALLGWADRCLGQNLSVSLRIREHHTLVISGPYRWVRHPIYTATLLYAAGLSVVTANYVLAAMIFAPMAFLVAQRLGSEEQMMINEFGDEYRAYMQRTGRLVPRWRRA